MPGVKGSPLLLGGLALLLASCASQPSASPSPAANTAPLAAGPPPLSGPVSQTLQAAFAAQTASLQCGMSASGNDWNAVCVTPFGLRVLSVGVNHGVVTAEKGVGVPAQLRPEQVLADMQLVFWPQAALDTAFAGSAWQLSSPAPRTRRLTEAGQLVAEVHYADSDPWNGQVWLSNLRYGYSLIITTAAAPTE